jgi:hypothetical protein
MSAAGDIPAAAAFVLDDHPQLVELVPERLRPTDG